MNGNLERVYQICQYVRETNNGISFKQLIARTRYAFNNSSLSVTIKTKKDNSFAPAEFSVSGFYDAEDDFNGDPPIEIVINHNFTDKDKFDRLQIGLVLKEIYDATVHELRHQYQSIQRKYAIYSVHPQSPYDEYLSDPDEVDAYALSVAIELLRNMPKHRAIKYMSRITALSKIKQNNLLVSPNLQAYISHFGLNNLTKKFAKKVYKHLERLDNSLIFK